MRGTELFTEIVGAQTIFRGSCYPGSVLPPEADADREIADHLERVIRRIKYSMRYRGSFTTSDILDSLVLRWVQSGEWSRLKALPVEERHLGESVRRFILDRLDYLRRRGPHVEIGGAVLAIPDDAALAEAVAGAELRAWIEARIQELERGHVDPRVLLPVPQPVETGQVLRGHLDGCTQRELAERMRMSLGVVHKRLTEGRAYLAVLHDVVEGGV